jgi:hypothetical protein
MQSINFNIRLCLLLTTLALTFTPTTNCPQLAGFLGEKQLASNGSCSQPVIVSADVIQLGNCDNQYFLIPLNVGTPPQQINCILATVDPFLWILAQTPQQSGFDLTVSSSFQMTNYDYTLQVLPLQFRILASTSTRSKELTSWASTKAALTSRPRCWS